MPIRYAAEIVSMDALWILFNTTGWNKEYHITVDDLAMAVRKSSFIVAAYDGDRFIGFGRVLTDGVLHAMIYDLITDPAYQGRGVGSEVLKMLVKKCRQSGIRDVQLFCAAGKRNFYEKRGFVARNDDALGMEYGGANDT